jgi:hypothetical protein
MKVREALARGRDGVRQAGTAVLDADIGQLGARAGRFLLWLSLAGVVLAGIAWTVLPPQD